MYPCLNKIYRFFRQSCVSWFRRFRDVCFYDWRKGDLGYLAIYQRKRLDNWEIRIVCNQISYKTRFIEAIFFINQIENDAFTNFSFSCTLRTPFENVPVWRIRFAIKALRSVCKRIGLPLYFPPQERIVLQSAYSKSRASNKQRNPRRSKWSQTKLGEG